MPFWVNEDGATAVKAQKMDQLSGLGKKKNRNHFTQEGILEFTWKNEQVCHQRNWKDIYFWQRVIIRPEI